MDLNLHHAEEHFSGSDFIRDVVVGMSATSEWLVLTRRESHPLYDTT
ncbi:hypothetical protein [Bacillus xiapuensis]|uniref:Uncharacterized protein n=1 Tax=Bacillus xiapuensis TaxID=2014075 RepID=A0ABU6N8H6_9BACI|nr:hypothetical protein [Bacillus xiapuensis]